MAIVVRNDNNVITIGGLSGGIPDLGDNTITLGNEINPIQEQIPGGGGTDDHALLNHLDYANSNHTGFAPALGVNDNYVTDAEKTIIGNTSGTNTGDDKTGVTGILKGNGSSISAAGDGTDYLSSSTGLKLDQTVQQSVTGSPIFNTVQLSTTPTVGTFANGKIFYDNEWKTAAIQTNGDVTLQINQESVILVYNNSGINMVDGQPVYETGVGNDGIGGVTTSTVALAKADNITTSNVKGVCTQHINNGSYGLITTVGFINNFDTTSFGTVNNDLYLSTTVAGGLTTTKPVTPYIAIKVGKLIVKDVTVGRIEVQGISWGDLYEELDLKASNFIGIDSSTPITANDISVDTTSRVLTVTPSLGFFYYYTDGAGTITKHTQTGNLIFPAFTDTSGIWYFYIDSTGTAIVSQTKYSNLDQVTTIARVLWNATLTGADKITVLSFDSNLNTTSVYTRLWEEKYGTIVTSGGSVAANTLPSGAPAVDGSNTVVALNTLNSLNANLPYTIINSTGGLIWQQDLGNTNPTLLNATNSAMFPIRYQDAGGLSYILPATRFPFDWNPSTNTPYYITSTGTRTGVGAGNFFVYYIYSFQDPRNGQGVRLVSAITDYGTINNARASLWSDIQSVFLTLNDPAIRPLYRLIFQYQTGWNIGTKKTVLREIEDLKVSRITASTSTGIVLASSVSVTPYGAMTSTNAQSALEELDNHRVTAFQVTPDDTHYPSEKLVSDQLGAKQATLVSATNIKTIGGQSILGAGDLTVAAAERLITYSTTATAGGTTTFTVSSNYQQYFTGTANQTVVLPVVSTLSLGFAFNIVNLSTGIITIQSSGGNQIMQLLPQNSAAATEAILTCILLTGTGVSSWQKESGVIPSTSTTEYALTTTNNGVKQAYTITEQYVSAGTIASATWTTGIATFTGQQGQFTYDSNWFYFCIAANAWIRYPIALGLAVQQLYLNDITTPVTDASGTPLITSALNTAYPSAINGQRVWGIYYLYEFQGANSTWVAIIKINV